MPATKPHRLSDGTTITIKTDRTIAGTYYYETPSRHRKGATFMRLERSMYLLTDGHIIPISHPDYAYAPDDKAGAAKALAFCVDSAEACITHAEEEGIPVDWCYTLDRPATVNA